MTKPAPVDLRAAERWFLRRGMPAVLSARARWRGVLPRSAPALAAWAALMVTNLFVDVASGGNDIDIANDPTLLDWLIFAALVATPPVVLLTAWLVSWITSVRVRQVIAWTSIATGMASDLYQDGPLDAAVNILVDAAIVASILLATVSGVGAVLGWAVRMTVSQLRSAGRLMARALPVLLLTVLVFFNSTVWSIATSLETRRLWMMVAFLAIIAASFLVAESLDAVRPLLTAGGGLDDHGGLSTTPLAGVTAGPTAHPLGLRERVNLVVVAAATQIIQVLILAVLTGTIFFCLGLITLNPTVLGRLTYDGPTQSVWQGMTVPVAPAQVHMTVFLIVLTFMYVSARAAGDSQHRADFVDPMVADLGLTVAARDRYRACLRPD